MASIDLTYKGLTGAYGSITGFDDTTTVDDLIAAIAADEGLDTNYYTISKISDPSNTLSISFGDSTTSVADLGIVDGDTIICTTNQTGTKESRQIQKLDIAAAKRNENYDRDKLPTKYSGNTIVNNAGTLEQRRPWIIDWSRTMAGMVLWLDASDSDSYSGTGTTWTDLAGTPNNFTLFNTPTWNSDGYFDFDRASSEYAAITHTATLKPTSGLTIEQWLNADDWTAGIAAAPRTALSCTQAGGYAHYIWDGDFISYVYLVNISNYIKPTYDVSAFTGWHHFATTFDGRFVRLYVDGVLVDTKDSGSTTNISYDPDNDICIGAEAGTLSTPSANYYWDGKIATTAIYNRALTATEILKNYNSDRSRFGV